MGKFDGILICTDLDGTLIGRGGKISEENIEAIEYFKKEGGYFTFVTGRMPFIVEHIYNAVKPNAPIGCINGGGLYDFEKREYIWAQMLADGVDELLSAVEERVPTVGFQVNTLKNCYFCKENVIMERFRRGTGLPNLTADYKNFSEPICRALFGCETEEEIVAVENILRSHPKADDFFFIRSEKVLFEIVAKGMNKGVSITKLAEYLDLDPKKTVAIGDYNNDIPMFEASGLGIAVANACADAKAAADFITVSNLDHAVAKVIYDMEKGVYPL